MSKQTPSVREALLLLKDASVAEIDHLISNLHQIKEAREHLESLFSDGVKAVKNVAKTVVEEAVKVAPKKRRSRVARTVKAKAPEMKPAVKRRRKAGGGLGPARPGTLRAMVHDALKTLGPIKTNALVRHLEGKLGEDAGKSFRVRVNQVLINRRDPFIKKVARGVYKYSA